MSLSFESVEPRILSYPHKRTPGACHLQESREHWTCSCWVTPALGTKPGENALNKGMNE